MFVLKYKLGEIDVQNMQAIYDTVLRSLPEHSSLIAIPDIIELHDMTVDELVKYRDFLDRIIEEEKLKCKIME